MDAAASGDIFPAREAIRRIDEVDLTPPIEVPPISSDAYPANVPAEEHAWLRAEIERLKKERNAYILAHNYARPRISRMSRTRSVIRFISRTKAPHRMLTFSWRRRCFL
jgi:hypothetical protein